MAHSSLDPLAAAVRPFEQLVGHRTDPLMPDEPGNPLIPAQNRPSPEIIAWLLGRASRGSSTQTVVGRPATDRRLTGDAPDATARER